MILPPTPTPSLLYLWTPPPTCPTRWSSRIPIQLRHSADLHQYQHCLSPTRYEPPWWVWSSQPLSWTNNTAILLPSPLNLFHPTTSLIMRSLYNHPFIKMSTESDWNNDDVPRFTHYSGPVSTQPPQVLYESSNITPYHTWSMVTVLIRYLQHQFKHTKYQPSFHHSNHLLCNCKLPLQQLQPRISLSSITSNSSNRCSIILGIQQQRKWVMVPGIFGLLHSCHGSISLRRDRLEQRVTVQAISATG